MSTYYPYTWPRHYAAHIIALKTRPERRDALAAVPIKWREWVAVYVRDYFAKRKAVRRHRYA